MKRWAWIRGEASCVVLARSAGVCVLLGMVAQIADAQSADNPLGDATIVWHLSSRQANENYPLDLRINGTVQVGQELDAADRAQSLKRGGDGLAAVFDGGYLSLDVHRAMSLRAKDDALSLYIRARGNPGIEGTLFFSDMLTFAVHPTGLAISFLGVKTPSGRVFREVPLGLIKRDGWLDFVIRIGDRKLDFFQNGELRNSTPINQALCAPFDDVLQIGAFAWSGPDLYEYTPVGIRNCTIDAVALWGRALSDNEVAFLSGVESLQAPTARNRMDRAIQDYNEFFDASVNKDVAACGRLWKSLRELADQDPVRPTFHLTQPFGCIFDPVGAYYFEGRYHVFSYHNITNLLRYSSLDHYVSDDLVHWTAWPIGPWADCPLDVYGIWLMNHFVDDQGLHFLNCQTILGGQCHEASRESEDFSRQRPNGGDRR